MRARTSPLPSPLLRGSRWLDQRNQSRIAQFEANRAALLASATAEEGAGLGAGAGAGGEEKEAEKEVDPKSKTFGTTAEFAGLAARLLHVGVGQVCVCTVEVT